MPDSNTESSVPATQFGYSAADGVDWSEYQAYRPIYPESFFQRLFSYHNRKQPVQWSVAHDVGAGCGIVSSALAKKFETVIVSDPNDGYVELAEKLLVGKASLPKSQFRFLQESGEESSVSSGTVDLITVCEAIHWMDTGRAIEQFARELVSGGTLVMTYYTRALIDDNEPAQAAWKDVWDLFAEKSQGELFTQAHIVGSSGLDAVQLPPGQWKDVERVYINAPKGSGAFELDNRVGPSKVGPDERQIWEDDEDWCHLQGFEYFPGYFATWPHIVPGSEIQGIWDKLKLALGDEEVKTKTPFVIVFATKV